jgi:hypothetical protein
MHLAEGHAALAATAGLLGRLFGLEAGIDLVEILASGGGGAFLRRLLLETDELQHALSHRNILETDFAARMRGAAKALTKLCGGRQRKNRIKDIEAVLYFPCRHDVVILDGAPAGTLVRFGPYPPGRTRRAPPGLNRAR